MQQNIKTIYIIYHVNLQVLAYKDFLVRLIKKKKKNMNKLTHQPIISVILYAIMHIDR